MKVREIMSLTVASCDKDAPIREVARMMAEHDCGMIPIVERNGATDVIGTVTDRDIALRIVANGRDLDGATAKDAMSKDPICIHADQSLDEAEELMKRHQIRRLVVLDDNGNCCGVLAQADIARHESKNDTGRLVSRISAPSEESHVRH